MSLPNIAKCNEPMIQKMKRSPSCELLFTYVESLSLPPSLLLFDIQQASCYTHRMNSKDVSVMKCAVEGMLSIRSGLANLASNEECGILQEVTHSQSVT